jgi:hypothetical protein
MPVGTQAKLLRVLEERKLRRLGARTEQDVDVRVLAATNRDPDKAVPGAICAPIFTTGSTSSTSHAAAARASGGPAGHGRRHAVEMNQKHGRRVSGVARRCSTG